MPRTCTVCRHAKKAEIDEALLAGTPFRNIAKRYDTSTTALFRHRAKDLPATLVKAKQVSEEVTAESLYERLHAINRETAKILQEARKTASHEIALKAIARVERQVELEARLLGELRDSTTVAVGIGFKTQSGNHCDVTKLSDEELDQIIVQGYERLIAHSRPGKLPSG